MQISALRHSALTTLSTLLSLSLLTACGGGAAEGTQLLREAPEQSRFDLRSGNSNGRPDLLEEADDTSDVQDEDPAGNVGNDTDNEPNVLAEIEHLDCGNLDPDKVYLLGALFHANYYWGAIIDPEDPYTFCFDAPPFAYHAISNGSIIYSRALGDEHIRRMTQDALGVDSETRTWTFAEDLLENDEILLENGRSNEVFSPEGEGSVMYFVRHNDIYTLDNPDTPYYERVAGLQGTVITVTPQGGILTDLYNGGLTFVDPDLNKHTLEPTEEGEVEYHSARMADANTLWLHVRDASGNDARWSIRVDTLEVAVDGYYAEPPENTAPYQSGIWSGRGSKMNGEGRLIQVVQDPSKEDREKGIIIDRPLETSRSETRILYLEAEYSGNHRWKEEQNPFVNIGRGVLITGH